MNVATRWTSLVYSSARKANVLRMLTALRLVPEQDIQKTDTIVHCIDPMDDVINAGVGEHYPLRLIWSREVSSLLALSFLVLSTDPVDLCR